MRACNSQPANALKPDYQSRVESRVVKWVERMPENKLKTQTAVSFASRLANRLFCGAILFGFALGGCTVAEVSPNSLDSSASPASSAAEAPGQLPKMRLSARSVVPIDSITESQLDKNIAIAGEITQKAAMLEGLLYRVTDETGSVWVVRDHDSKGPEVGESATVEGAVRYEPIAVGEVDASEFYLEEKAYQREGSGSADG